MHVVALAICFTVFRKAVTFSVLGKCFAVMKLHFLRFYQSTGKLTQSDKRYFPPLRTMEICYFIMTHTQYFWCKKKISPQYFLKLQEDPLMYKHNYKCRGMLQKLHFFYSSCLMTSSCFLFSWQLCEMDWGGGAETKRETRDREHQTPWFYLELIGSSLLR